MIKRSISILWFAIITNCQFSIGNCFAQEVPLGTWRTHNSYNSVHSVALSSNKVYAASVNGITIVDLSENSLASLTRLDGLSSSGITAVAYDQPRNQLLVSYEDGMLDIISASQITQYSGLKNSATIAGSKRINGITVRQESAYLSTDYGVVVFDLNQLEVKETWRDLGPAGQTVRIIESTFLQDSIFLATASGVLAGNMSDNLLDFAKWKRFDQGPFSSAVESIAVFSDRVYAAIDGEGLYAYESGLWALNNFSGSDFNKLSSAGNLLITADNGLWKLSPTGTLTPINNEFIGSPIYATEDEAGKLWIGDSRNGLVSDYAGPFQRYNPNGPTFNASFRLVYNENRIHSVSGGYNSNFLPAGNLELVNNFSSGLWSADASLIDLDVTDIAFSGTKTFVSTFGSGLQVVENGSSSMFTNLNSPLSTNRITATAISKDGVWVTNYGAAQSLHLLKPDNTWESFSFGISAAQYPMELVVDKLNQVWMTVNPAQGGGIVVFSREKNQHVYLTEGIGSGALPSRSVYSLAVDRDGWVWTGTGAGVAYFPNPAQVFSGSVNSVKPIINGRILLRDETVTSIAVDGGNRKWMGAQRGVWLFGPSGEDEMLSFNTTNSPLPSDKVVCLEIHPETGEVFFGTDQGIVSYRADATESTPSFTSVKIFPNPVTAEFQGTVSISGLATDATVKITDISGKLVWQTYANGGTATWNVRDYTGSRAATGMYLVIAVSQDGSDSLVGKIAVIN